MSSEKWAEVDTYLEATVAPDGADLEPIRAAQAAGGLPDIAVSPTQGKFLYLLARIAGARRILEIGTLGGYSTAWLARAVGPDGAVVTLEYDPRHAEVARASLDEAGFGALVEIRVGPAVDSLPFLDGPFDLVFIDADKANNRVYLDWAVRLSRPGTVIVLDNVVRRLGESSPEAEGIRSALERFGTDPRLDATALQTVGVKGWDGLAVAQVR
ncbi:O-methyltransferase [Tsukamurella sp. PLM1]|uniref:O-methyltransferase n=1 Tax=Tsukamurella sp. PLM1 TaxID=2929795 RepID=UPI0020BD73B4|nr:O-methyltransferase [Tsukamurella sp. PLM1]